MNEYLLRLCTCHITVSFMYFSMKNTFRCLSHTHTHTHIYIYIYIKMNMSMKRLVFFRIYLLLLFIRLVLTHVCVSSFLLWSEHVYSTGRC